MSRDAPDIQRPDSYPAPWPLFHYPVSGQSLYIRPDFDWYPAEKPNNMVCETLVNPLRPDRTNSSCIAKISILK